MKVILNGEEIITQATTLMELVHERALPTEGTAIALGTRIIRRTEWEHTPLGDAVQITLIRATQGG